MNVSPLKEEGRKEHTHTFIHRAISVPTESLLRRTYHTVLHSFPHSAVWCRANLSLAGVACEV